MQDEVPFPEGPGWVYRTPTWVMSSGVYLYDKAQAIRLWAYDNQETVNVMSLVFALWALMATVRLYRRWRRNKLRLWIGATMPKGDRKNYLKAFFADGYHDFLFDAFCDNKISAQEYRAELTRVGRDHDLPDLLRPKTSKPGIAHRIRTNVEAMRKSLDRSHPRIPGGKPGEDTLPEYKDLGSEFLDRVKPKAS